MKKVKINDKIEVYSRRNPNGYGYEIIKETEIDKKRTRYHFQRIFHSYNPELINEIITKINSSSKIPETWPDISKEVPPIRILRFESKHYNYHFDVQTPEKFEKAARKIMKEESESYGYYPPDPPQNDSGIQNVEELKKIGIDTLRKEVEQKFKNYQDKFKRYNSDLRNWNNLQLVLKGNGNFSNIINAFRDYEPDRWQIIDLDSLD